MSRYDALEGMPGGRRLSHLGRPTWYRPKVRVESSSHAPKFYYNREIYESFSAGPEARIEAIEKSLLASKSVVAARSESRSREYVERSFAARRARFQELIASLRQAFDDDDIVTAYGEWVSLRWLLNDLRFAAKKERGERWHMFGAIHDAVAFTAIERLCLPMIEAVAQAFTLACSGNASFIDVHRSLRDGGLDQTPQRSR